MLGRGWSNLAIGFQREAGLEKTWEKVRARNALSLAIGAERTDWLAAM
jgi:hypothetical protein